MFCTITPTRNDRPQLLDFCKFQLSQMNTKPYTSYFIDYKPKTKEIDLIPRIKTGIAKAKADGFDQVMILENDDWYPADYFDNIGDADFTGCESTTYYNLRNRTYQDWHHPKRSSLFTTGFKISALEGFKWPEDNEPFLDISLWLYANQSHKKIMWRETKAIGIKHGIGLCGGKGHVQQNKYMDRELEWLKANTDPIAFDFYKSIKF